MYTGGSNPFAAALAKRRQLAEPDAVQEETQDYSQDYGQDQAYEQGDYGETGADQSYDQSAYDQGGYDQGGYDQTGYDQSGYDQAGYDQYEYGQTDDGGGTTYQEEAPPSAAPSRAPQFSMPTSLTQISYEAPVPAAPASKQVYDENMSELTLKTSGTPLSEGEKRTFLLPSEKKALLDSTFRSYLERSTLLIL